MGHGCDKRRKMAFIPVSKLFLTYAVKNIRLTIFQKYVIIVRKKETQEIQKISEEAENRYEQEKY